MVRNLTCRFSVVWLGLGICLLSAFQASAEESGSSYDDLLKFHAQWRKFEQPPMRDGAPDYTAETFNRRYETFRELRTKLSDFEIEKWPVPQQVDWHLIRAEMNGFDFNHRVLKPWVRDPAFYQSIWMARSDVPAHEGPTHHAVTEVWTYKFPLGEADERRLIKDLKVIPPLMRQARQNLTGNAKNSGSPALRTFVLSEPIWTSSNDRLDQRQVTNCCRS